VAGVHVVVVVVVVIDLQKKQMQPIFACGYGKLMNVVLSFLIYYQWKERKENVNKQIRDIVNN
jgi:hypothetical protein